jgi:hypothetical protein
MMTLLNFFVNRMGKLVILPCNYHCRDDENDGENDEHFADNGGLPWEPLKQTAANA